MIETEKEEEEEAELKTAVCEYHFNEEKQNGQTFSVMFLGAICTLHFFKGTLSCFIGVPLI